MFPFIAIKIITVIIVIIDRFKSESDLCLNSFSFTKLILKTRK